MRYGVNLLAATWWANGHFFLDEGKHLLPLTDEVLRANNRYQTRTRAFDLNELVPTTTSPVDLTVELDEPAQQIILTIVPRQDINQKDLRISLVPRGAAGVFKPRFQNLVDKFKVLRLMDLCGAFGDQALAYQDKSLSAILPAPPGADIGNGNRWANDVTAFDPRELKKLRQVIDEVWINIPPLLNREEQVKFLREFVSFRKVWVSWSNECWNGGPNGGFPQAQYCHINGRSLHSDPYVGQALFYARKVDELRAVCTELGTQFQPILEWQASNAWAFSLDVWNNNTPVCQEIRDILQRVGHIAIAPYFHTPSAVEEALSWVRNWRTITDGLNVKLHAYESGQHYFGAPEFQVSTEMLNAWGDYLPAMEGLFDSDAIFCLYGLVGDWSAQYGAWGLLRSFTDENEKWNTVQSLISPSKQIECCTPGLLDAKIRMSDLFSKLNADAKARVWKDLKSDTPLSIDIAAAYLIAREEWLNQEN